MPARPERYEQHSVGRVQHIGKAVAESKGLHGDLPREARQVGERCARTGMSKKALALALPIKKFMPRVTPYMTPAAP